VIDGHPGHLTTTSHSDGRPIDVMLRFGKHGSTLAGLTDALGQAISVGLQAGVPMEEYVSAFADTEFAPAGRTDDPELPPIRSVLDYVGRRLDAPRRIN
jgi:ribonucleoside-diphosphate reductase alpha chain